MSLRCEVKASKGNISSGVVSRAGAHQFGGASFRESGRDNVYRLILKVRGERDCSHTSV